MASVAPIIILFGSSECISELSLRIPVTFKFAFHQASLTKLITANQTTACLPRYFVVLLQPIDDDLLELLRGHHRVRGIYGQQPFADSSAHCKLHRVISEHRQQFVLDLTQDIVDFFAKEGEKQASLERIDLASIYYRQGRTLNEWVMSFSRVEKSDELKSTFQLMIPLT